VPGGPIPPPLRRPRGPPAGAGVSAEMLAPPPWGPGPGAFTAREVSDAAAAGRLTDGMRLWARDHMDPGLMDVRMFTREEALGAMAHMPSQYTAAVAGIMEDRHYATNTLDGAMVEMHQSLASDGPLAHICNFYVELVMGTGFRPELEPMPMPGDDPDSPRECGGEELDAMAYLQAADLHQGEASGALWPSMFSAVSQLVKLTTVYHRACIVKHGSATGGAPMAWNGEECKEVPVALEVVHPRDLGMVGLNDQKVPVSIYRNWPGMERIPLPKCVYMTADLEGCQVYNSAGYGLSPMSGCVDAARLYDRLEKQDLPAVAQTSWTRIPLVFVNLPGGDVPERARLLRELSSQIAPGGPCMVGLDPESVKVEDLDMKPVLADMDNLRVSLLNYMAAHMNLPQVSVGEKDTTRASSSAKSNLMVQGSIQPRRNRVGELLARKWYMPMLRARYPKVAREWRVRVVFDNLDTESLAQKVEAINGIMANFALKKSSYGRLLNIHGFENMVDEERQRRQEEAQLAGPQDSSGARATGGKNPGPGPGNKRSVGRPDEVNER